MRIGKRCLTLLAVLLLTVMGCGLGAVLAGEAVPGQVTGTGRVTGMTTGTRLGGAVATASDATDATASTPSNTTDATVGTPSDATGTPVASASDAESDEVLLLMDLDISGEGCGTQEELVEQLLDDDRERIVLSSDILWTRDTQIIVSGEKEVEMGTYSIIVEETGGFYMRGPVVFTGGGDRPMFVVRGDFGAGAGVEIYARGDHAVAVEVAGGDWSAKEVQIHASGTDACAVRFTGSRQWTVELCKIEAEGVGSRGIEAEGALRVLLSSVHGEAAAVCSERGELLLFGCDLSPEPEHGGEIDAMVLPDNRLEENGICIAAGSAAAALQERLADHAWMSWKFFSDQTEVEGFYVIPAVWSEIPTDLSWPGTQMAQCSPVEVPAWFPVELYNLEVPIHIVDPDRPFIKNAEDAGSAVFLQFFAPIQGAEEIRVEYSLDERGSWRDAAELPASFVTDGAASVEPLELGRDYWFRLVVEGGPMAGVSNEILFVGDEMRKANGGGDRDHGDRDDQGDTPPQGEIIPPPDDTGSDDTESNGTESDGTNPGGARPGGTEPGGTEPAGTEPSGSNADETNPNGPNADETNPSEPNADGTNPSGTHPDATNPSKTHPDAMNPSGPNPSEAEPREVNQNGTNPDRANAPTLPPETTPITGIVSSDAPSPPPIRLLSWILLPAILLIGGSAYACWKKRMGNH